MDLSNIQLEVENDLKNMYSDLKNISVGFKTHVAPEIRKDPKMDQPIYENDPILDIESINKLLESYKYEPIIIEKPDLQEDDIEKRLPPIEKIEKEPVLSDEECYAKLEELLSKNYSCSPIDQNTGQQSTSAEIEEAIRQLTGNLEE